jgi:hypothetical protein
MHRSSFSVCFGFGFWFWIGFGFSFGFGFGFGFECNLVLFFPCSECVGYRKTAMEPDEVLVHVSIPFPAKDTYIR